MIKVLSYQSRWPEEFKLLKEKINAAVSEKIIAIHHIGSTSVPDLAAKDVIDIQITVESFDSPIESALNDLGFESTNIKYDHCPPGMTLSDEELEKRYYRGRNPMVNLHLRKIGSFNQMYPILFRDFLRNNPKAREAYGEIKVQLAKYFPENVEAYYDVKDPVCDLIILNALEWAKSTNWEQKSI